MARIANGSAGIGRGKTDSGTDESNISADDAVAETADYDAGTPAPESERTGAEGTSEAVIPDIDPVTGKKRRKKRGPNKPKDSAKALLDWRNIAPKIQGAHQFAAIFTGIPVLVLSESESEQLAKSLCNVAQYYDLPVGGKGIAWVELIATLGVLYGTRIFAHRKMQQELTAQKWRDEQAGSLDSFSEHAENGAH